MSSELSDDERERIETYCETPPYDRSPEDLLPNGEYDDVPRPREESEGSLFRTVWDRLRSRF
ncbi:hypothetical protein [Halorussus sp. MSC15.2]|uniref:hypothetical protein n=1 Tax=Halorussus sp. MSC15.2 TaxID=2283638 RepID=UPI0013D6CB7E|nr:hypothetical protein [Halorussus sp. MSC15.2]NEU58075.1 hypothetical protein [Halorussus sp. MSC15.2]